MPKIISVEAIKDYKIKLNYETGEVKLFNRVVQKLQFLNNFRLKTAKLITA
ncbi:MAG: hypothetical protein LBF83_01235 [Spirochaetaceae bacterium]|nr:hypothetical protein [Spirochaetaceae bacterium]